MMANKKAIKIGQFLSIWKIPQDRDSSRRNSSSAISIFTACLIVLLCSSLSEEGNSPVPSGGGNPVPDGLLLSGLERQYKSERATVNGEAEAERQGVKKSSGLLTKGVLGMRAQVVKNIPVTKEVAKHDGVLDKAAGTGPVLIEEKGKANKTSKSKSKSKKGKKEKAKVAETENEESEPTPEEPADNVPEVIENGDEDGEEEPKDKRNEKETEGRVLPSGLHNVADLGKDQGKEFKIAPK